ISSLPLGRGLVGRMRAIVGARKSADSDHRARDESRDCCARFARLGPGPTIYGRLQSDALERTPELRSVEDDREDAVSVTGTAAASRPENAAADPHPEPIGRTSGA